MHSSPARQEEHYTARYISVPELWNQEFVHFATQSCHFHRAKKK